MAFFDDDGREWPDDAELCDMCGGLGTANCYCGGDLCVCENYGEMECPRCHGEAYFNRPLVRETALDPNP